MINTINKIPGTQQDIAKAIGVSQSTVSQWSLGKKFPSAKNAKKIKIIFGISFDEIYQNYSAPTPTETKHGK